MSNKQFITRKMKFAHQTKSFLMNISLNLINITNPGELIFWDRINGFD